MTEPLRGFDPTSRDGWDRRAATHLLWRTGFGAAFGEIEQAVSDGLAKTLDRLLTPQAETAEFEATETLLLNTTFDTGNIADLKAWWLYRMLRSANPLVEKLTLFWHNHFATSYAKVQSVRQMAAQNQLIRRHASVSFRHLLHEMTRDVAMLVWLDGNANRKRHPNENFAREVMELFSLGVGNYSERDIQEAARAFTGWHVRDGQFWFHRTQHDFGTKQVFGKSGDFDGSQIIDLCLDQEACPRFLAGKLLRSFVTPEPSSDEVAQLAGRIRVHDFQMAPVLRELFGSELFFDERSRHAIIKSPVDLVLGAVRALDGQPNLPACASLAAQLGQNLFEPPTVKGWEGGRLWVNSATMIQRANFAAALTGSNQLGAIADPAELAERRGWTTDDSVMHGYLDLLLSRELDAAAMSPLENFQRTSSGSRSERLRGLIHLIMCLPEFQQV